METIFGNSVKAGNILKCFKEPRYDPLSSSPFNSCVEDVFFFKKMQKRNTFIKMSGSLDQSGFISWISSHKAEDHWLDIWPRHIYRSNFFLIYLLREGQPKKK